MNTFRSIFLMFLLAACVEGGTDTESQPTPKPGSTPVVVDEARTVSDIDGNEYGVVQIGAQFWMSENLRTTRYRNGVAIPYDSSDEDSWWPGLSVDHNGTIAHYEEVGMRCVYDHDEANWMTYGQLYTWFAVKDERGLCPSGWHVPSDDEWNALERTLGLSSVDTKETGWRGVHGASMKSEAWDGTNESGFSALPGGYHNYGGGFDDVGNYGYWWSSSPDGSGLAWLRGLYYGRYYGRDYVYRGSSGRRDGFSVRCVRD